jgi:beta-D-galactosyl-(1->4)-L-rhamnose phosphorylase
VLTAWGDLRAWICSGHFTHGLELNELIESLAGLPLDVQFISFDDLRKNGVPKGVKVIINAGREGSAWSGGHYWDDPKVQAILTQWVQKGGGFIGVGEPSAVPQPGQLFKLAHVLGLDRDRGERIANGKYKYAAPALPGAPHFITADLTGAPDFGKDVDGIYVFGPDTQVLADRDNSPRLATHAFGKGRAVYASGFKFTPRTRACCTARSSGPPRRRRSSRCGARRTSAPSAPTLRKKKKLVVINNAGEPQQTIITLADGQATKPVSLAAHGIAILDV